MGLGTLLKTTLHAVTIPIEIVKDVATMGGDLTDQHETYTFQRLKKLDLDVKEIEEEVSDL